MGCPRAFALIGKITAIESLRRFTDRFIMLNLLEFKLDVHLFFSNLFPKRYDMNKMINVLTAVFLFGGLSVSVQAATPLVDVEWVKQNIGKPGVVFLDLRRPSSYKKGHVPGAVFTSYVRDGWRVKNDAGTIGMLPPVENLTTLIGGLGIGNDDHVVLLPAGNNSTDMGIGTRIYWTFKVLGHDKVSILNGGMRVYKKAKKPANPLEEGINQPVAKTFNAELKQQLVLSMSQVKQSLDAGAVFVDSRTDDQFMGLNKYRKAKRIGTITGSINLPQDWTTVGGKGVFRDKAALETIFASRGVPTSGEVVTFCNTGHWASIDWFVLSELLGNDDARMYDGSMVEWSADPSMPMERKITF